LQSLGVFYSTQVDESTLQPTFLAGFPATELWFESFTHEGRAVNVDSGINFGTANLVARAPLGTWTPAHDVLLDAIINSVQIAPPTAENAPIGLRTGYRAPDFSATLRDGTTVDTIEGKLTFVHFWFVDCPYCRSEWPHVQSVYEVYADDGVIMLAVNAIDSPAYIDSYYAAEGLTVPVVLDDGSLHDLFNVSAFPTTYVIGPDGVIVQVARGPMTEQAMVNLVEQYLLD
jgi:peroxiredoxin